MSDKHISGYNQELRQFVAAARLVAELLGTAKEGWGYGYAATGEIALVCRYEYTDGRIHIEAARDTQAIHIEMREPHVNPVVSIYDGGRVVRVHGEWRMIRSRVLDLARSALQEQAER